MGPLAVQTESSLGSLGSISGPAGVSMDPKGVQKKSDESGKGPMGSNSSKVGVQIYSIEVKWV